MSHRIVLCVWWAEPSGELCQEEKLLYKLISGLHSSISIHIEADYLLDEAKYLVKFLVHTFMLYLMLVTCLMWGTLPSIKLHILLTMMDPISTIKSQLFKYVEP